MEKEESSSEPLGEVQPELEQQQASCEVHFFRFSNYIDDTYSEPGTYGVGSGGCERRGSRAS
jgi:hypothetical protein